MLRALLSAALSLCGWILFFLLLTFLFFAFAPLQPDIDVQPFNPKVLPEFTGHLSKNDLLSSAKKMFENKVVGPESLVIGEDGFYSGLNDGRIVRLNPDTGDVHLVLKIGGTDCGVGKTKCGFPLGLRFDSQGYLCVADGYKGIYKVNTTTGEVEVLVDSSEHVEGKKINFFNDLVVSKEDDIYFTEFGLPSDDFVLYTIEHKARGRIHHYNPITKKTSVLLDSVFGANGIELTPEEDALLISQYYGCNILKLFIKGPKKGQSQIFADNLPGNPDNIRRTNRNTYWLAFYMTKQPGQLLIHEQLGPYPLFRKAFFRSLVYTSRLLKSLETIKGIGPIIGIVEQELTGFLDSTVFDWNLGLVVELDSQGQIIRSFHSSDVSRTKFSQATEHKDLLYLGSPWNNYLGRIQL